MRISEKTVFDFTDKGKRRLGLFTASEIVGKYYCDQMTMSMLCTRNCTNCKEAVTKMCNLTNAINPEALLTYNAKAALAEAKDKTLDAKAFIKEPVPISEQTNIFETIFQ